MFSRESCGQIFLEIPSPSGAFFLVGFLVWSDWFFEFWILMSMKIGDVDRGLLLVVRLRGNFKKCLYAVL